MRALTSIEQTRLKLLTKYQISLALIEPTETGLNKSIMDATGSVRSFLNENDIHSYEHQRQGPENKILIRAKIYDSKNCYDSVASLYRPNTKNGDPRIWFKNLNTIASPNDIIAITYFDDSFHVFNLSKLDISEMIDLNLRTPFNELIEEISGKVNEVAFELLSKLKSIARQGLVPSMVAADTSVGRTLEKALGIEINSSKEPDYKGIELKSFRDSKVNRKNLFAQVPDWSLSKFKSSAEILEEFGYHRGEDFKLYCTVSAIVRNSQGLILKIDSEVKQLKENSNKPEIGDFVIWTLETLHKRLLEKHRETFWVKANSTYIDGREYFQYSSVEHTKKPIVSQFDILIEQGIITMDHLIKKNAQGKVVEKGPLFKIQPKGIDLLFPSSEKYSLTE